jgi:putative addiction module component (TIGR02574 family)
LLTEVGFEVPRTRRVGVWAFLTEGRKPGSRPVRAGTATTGAAVLRASQVLPKLRAMAVPFDIEQLTPQERIELAERLWDSLVEADIDLTPTQAAELERRRVRLAREGPQGRPWRDIVDGSDARGG